MHPSGDSHTPYRKEVRHAPAFPSSETYRQYNTTWCLTFACYRLHTSYAGAVLLAGTVIEDVLNQVLILFHVLSGMVTRVLLRSVYSMAATAMAAMRTICLRNSAAFKSSAA